MKKFSEINFLDIEENDEYKNTIDRVFGEGSCHVLIIRPFGGTKVIG